MAERFAQQRLKALAKVEGKADDGLPTVLFLCVHNAGRSQMALGWFNHLAGDRAVAWSGGSEPGMEVNPAAIEAMAEVGIDISEEFPKPWTDEIVRAADVVITMGCGDACPIFPGKRYEDWEVGPGRRSLDEVRRIRDDIGAGFGPAQPARGAHRRLSGASGQQQPATVSPGWSASSAWVSQAPAPHTSTLRRSPFGVSLSARTV